MNGVMQHLLSRVVDHPRLKGSDSGGIRRYVVVPGCTGAWSVGDITSGRVVAVGLVIFDCDGVLVDTERLTVGVEARLLTELGWPHTVDDVVERFLGRTLQAQLDEIAARLGADAARTFHDRSEAEIYAAFARELTPVPGVVALLDRLDAAGAPTCVASSGTHDKMRFTLGNTGLYMRFAGRIFSASEVSHGKPAPDLFLYAAERMGVDPQCAAVIEDSVHGVRAAVAAGAVAYGFAGGLAPRAALRDAGATVFDDFAELVEPLLGP
jgi:HAD superfamily hydrolase (TIGR01509 family)